MPKRAISVTLEESNLLWLQGRAATRKRRSVSDALDDVVTQARRGAFGPQEIRSVANTVDIAVDDPDLDTADAAVRTLVERSIGRPFVVRDRPEISPGVAPARRRPRRKRRG
jgi:hypothetical protein